MSWQSYVDDHMLVDLPNGGTLTHAAIFGQDGGAWARSAEFPDMTPVQVANIVKGFDNSDELAQAGVWVGNLKFLLIMGVPGEVVRGRQGPSGLCIKKTLTAIVIGIYGEGVVAADCNVLIEGLGDYLIGMQV